jgi:hypothetical protein
VTAQTKTAATEAALRFEARGGGEFDFDTGVLRGKLRANGRAIGLLPVVHTPSGMTLSRSVGLFSHYRVFSSNRRYGTAAWDWPGEAALRDDGSVEVRWPAAPDRPFEMWAVYRWSGPATLDLETGVRAGSELPGFEVFLSSYFTAPFQASVAYTQGRPGKDGGKPGFLAAEQAYGDWQMYPRDREAVSVITDGRWTIEPNPVNWAILPVLAGPVAFRRDSQSGLTAVLMAPPEECFAVSMPHQGERHYAVYLSLFGRTITAGEAARARARLVIAASPGEREILELYRAYLGQLTGRR